MKKLFTLCLFVSLVPAFISQNLTNIVWEVRMPAGDLIGYYKFTGNTLESSPDNNVSYTTIADLTMSVNSFTIHDRFSGGGYCNSGEIGIYNYNIITNDVADFNMISDPCTTRKNILQDFSWTRLGTTGFVSIIPGRDTRSMRQNEPNPFSGRTTIRYTVPKSVKESFLMIYDMSGREIHKYPLDKHSDSIDIFSENLSEGVYFYTLVCDEQASPSRRMIVTGH